MENRAIIRRERRVFLSLIVAAGIAALFIIAVVTAAELPKIRVRPTWSGSKFRSKRRQTHDRTRLISIFQSAGQVESTSTKESRVTSLFTVANERGNHRRRRSGQDFGRSKGPQRQWNDRRYDGKESASSHKFSRDERKARDYR